MVSRGSPLDFAMAFHDAWRIAEKRTRAATDGSSVTENLFAALYTLNSLA
jgi:hypothetical protein